MKLKFIFLFIVLFFISCTEKTDLTTFDFTDQSDIFGGNKFAVVVEKYLTTIDIPDENGISVEQLRCGEIFPIQEIIVRKTNGREVWVKINNGWALSSALQLYKTYEKAQTASERLQ